jgi:hypothetical protein
MKEYAAETWKSYTIFGGPAIMAPAAELLDSGRVLAVLAADLSWNTWDVATGNRLPFKTGKADYAKLLQVSSDRTGSSTDMDAIYGYLRTQLADVLPATKTPPKTAAETPVPPRAINELACNSQSGDFLIDIKLEVDPKQWKNGKHRVESAILRSSDGTSVNLLAKNIDFSALANLQLFS